MEKALHLKREPLDVLAAVIRFTSADVRELVEAFLLSDIRDSDKFAKSRTFHETRDGSP